MTGVGGADRSGGADRGRAGAAARSAEKAAACKAEKAAGKKAETPKGANPNKAATDYHKDTFTACKAKGQRDRALDVTREAPKGSVGAAINPMLDAVTAVADTVAARNMCAGTVGDFYESNRELLNSPATDENIRDFAQRETDFFESQADCARNVGAVMDADTRAGLIETSRDAQSMTDQARDALKSMADQARDALRSLGW